MRWKDENIHTYIHSTEPWSRDNSVGIALGYGLDDRDSIVRFPAGAGKFSPYHSIQNGSVAHPASYPMGIRGSFAGGKATGAWSWPLTSTKCRGQRMSGVIPPLPQYAFMMWCSLTARVQLHHKFLMATTGCGISHKAGKHTDKCSNNKTKWQNDRQIIFKIL
jgi:hypothetical protein